MHHTKDGGHGRLYRGPMVICKSRDEQSTDDSKTPVTSDTVEMHIADLLGRPSKDCDVDQKDIEWLSQYSARYTQDMEARRSTCQIL
jgi:hypothetical protein